MKINPIEINQTAEAKVALITIDICLFDKLLHQKGNNWYKNGFLWIKMHAF